MKPTSRQIEKINVVRVFYLYPDFRVRVNDNSPVHYDVHVRQVDSTGSK